MNSISTLAEQLIEMRLESHVVDQGAERLRRVEAGILVLTAVFWALHLVHLKADFPNHSFWVDWAKYTDEGWYGDAAIRHYLLGHWNVPGDFNPAAALPMWPAMELVLFRFTGVSLVAARAMAVVVFGAGLLCCYRLMRRWMEADGVRSLAPAGAVLLLAASPFCFVFVRLAILEPLLILLTLAALLVVSGRGENTLRAVGLGVLMVMMVLTKTTAIFLFPAIFWMLLAGCGYRLWDAMRTAAIACSVAGACWGAYYEVFVRPRYLVDYKYLFNANAYTGFTWKTLWPLTVATLFDGIWIGKTLFALVLLALCGLMVRLYAKGIRANPLPVALLLWVLGYAAFLTYHANLQPRYYLVLAVPLTALAVMVFEPLFVYAAKTWSNTIALPAGAVDVVLLRVTAGIALGAFVFAAVHAGWQMVGFLAHPEYQWVSTAAQVRGVIDREVAAHPERSRMMLSISGSDLSLMNGLPSICDDFGTMTLTDRIVKYKPGWFATWNEVEDDKMESLAPLYNLVKVAEYPAFDDYDRNILFLYRLDPKPVVGPVPPGRRRNLFVPHGAWARAAAEAAGKAKP